MPRDLRRLEPSASPAAPAGTTAKAGRRRPSRRVTALVAGTVMAMTITACQFARVGARCTSGFGRSNTHVLICRNHRWANWMTIGDYLRLVAAARARDAAAHPPPAPGGGVAPGASGVPSSPTIVRSWGADGVGWAALKVGNVVYVGGVFSTVHSPGGGSIVPRANLAAFDATTGALVGGFRADTNGRVKALATDGTRLFLGGNFTKVNGATRNHLAAVDLRTGAVQAWWTADANGDVYALSQAAGKLFVAGNFTSIRGASRQRIASLTAATGAVNGFVANAAGAGVDAIAASPDASRVYVGGGYSSINGTSTRNLTALGGNGAVQPVRFSGVSASATDLEVGAGGGVAAAFGGEMNEMAWFNPSTGAKSWHLDCLGDGQAVHSIGNLVFGGFHQSCFGDPTTHLVTVNIFGQRAGFTPEFDGFWGVRDVAGDAGALVVAGEFTRVDGVPAQGFAIYRPAP
jgi:hypothetical protein